MKKEMLVQALVEKGWFLQEQFLEADYCQELLKEGQNVEWIDACIGSNADRQVHQSIRNDSIYWIEEDKATPLQKNYLAMMNNLQQTLNRELFLGIREYECHFARYKSAGFYKKHLDQPRSQKRVISTICYLNEPVSGGELVIYNKDNPEKIEVTVKPKPGRFVCFLSNQIYHEVLPTNSERFSLTGWFRTV